MNLTTLARRSVYNVGAGLKLFRKEAPFLWPVNVEGMVQWQMGNFLSYAQDGFALNAIVYASIMYKIRAITQARARAYTGDPSQPTLLPPSHPLSRLTERPNEYMSWMELQGLLEAYLNLSGNAYLVIDREKQKRGIPSALWPVRPDEMHIIPSDKGLSGYLYIPRSGSWQTGVPMLPEDVIHIKFPNPMDRYEGLGYGLSPMMPLARSGDVDNSVTRFLKLFFDRGAMPAGLLKYDIPLDKEMVGEIKNRWRQVYGGIDNWTDIGILDMGASYQQLQHSFKEMGFDGLDERNEERIIGPFGVPPILIGSRFGLKHATYANYEEARRAFWEDTMMYEIRLFETEIQHAIVGDDESYIRYDLSGVPALRENVTELVDAASKLFMMSVPVDVALATVGIHIAPLPYGQVSYVPAQMREAGTPFTSAGTVVSGDDSVGDSAKSVNSQQQLLQRRAATKQRHTEAIGNVVTDWEQPYADKASYCFEEDEKALLAIAQGVARKALRQKATIDWTEVEEPFRAYLDGDGSTLWRETFTPLLGATVNDVGKLWSAELGVRFDLRDVLTEQWFQDYTLEFAQPINKTTGDHVHEILAQAQAEGWSNPVLQRRFQQVFRQWSKGDVSPEELEWLTVRLPDYRAEAIARTETNRAANGGSLALFRGWNVKKKEWSGSDDGRERPDHVKANGQVVDVDKPFTVGGHEMMHPGDASRGAPPEQFVNCRCSVLPIIEDTEELVDFNEIEEPNE